MDTAIHQNFYAVMWAHGWIKEGTGRGRLSAPSIQAIPRAKDLHLLMGGSYREIRSAPPKEDYHRD